MLRDWSYEMIAEPLPHNNDEPPDFTDGERSNDLGDIDNITDDVIADLSQEFQTKKNKLSRRTRNDINNQVYYLTIYD